MREPALHQQARGGEFGGERHRPIQPVEHGDGERGAGADETLRIQVEAAGVRHGHRQLAEAQHDEVDEQRTDGVRDDRAERARLMVRWRVSILRSRPPCSTSGFSCDCAMLASSSSYVWLGTAHSLAGRTIANTIRQTHGNVRWSSIVRGSVQKPAEVRKKASARMLEKRAGRLIAGSGRQSQ